jgi:hypothetical protein
VREKRDAMYEAQPLLKEKNNHSALISQDFNIAHLITPTFHCVKLQLNYD